MNDIVLKRPRSRLKGAIAALAVTFVLMTTLFIGLSITGFAQQDQQGILARTISQALSTQTSAVRIGNIEGALSSDATITDLAISDAKGVWLRVDRVRLVWRRLALLQRRLEVDKLEIGTVEFLRMPQSMPEPSKQEKTAAKGDPLLPELPLKIEVKDFDLKELNLGAPVAGVAARLAASGSVSLGKPSEGLNANLVIRKIGQDDRSTIKLSYVPKGQTLDVTLQHKEAAGGLLAHLAGIPGHPPVSLDLDGSGTLDDWRAKLDFTAGPTIGADGVAEIKRVGDARRMTLDLSSRIEGLLPPVVAGIFAGNTTLKGLANVGDDGSVTLSNFQIASNLAELVVSGRMSAEQNLDFTVTARAKPGSDGVTRRGDSSIGKLVFDGKVTGSITSPDVSGNLDVAQLRTPDGRLGTLSAMFALKPQPGDTFTLTADAQAKGIALADKAISQALGPELRARIRGKIDQNGVVDFEQAAIATVNMGASWRGKISASAVNGNVTAELRKLADFSALANRPLKGEVNLQADITGAPSDNSWKVLFAATTKDVSVNSPIFTRLAGPSVRANGVVETRDGSVDVQGITITGAGFKAEASGTLAQENSNLSFQLALAEARKIDPRLTGSVTIDGKVTGSMDNPDGTIRLRGDNVTAINKPIRNLDLVLEGEKLLGDVAAKFTLSGLVDKRDLAGEGTLRKQDGKYDLTGLDVRVGSARITGNANVASSGLTDGKLAIDAPALEHLSALVLTNLRGSLKADVALDASSGKQNATIKANGRSIRMEGFRLDRLEADIAGSNLLTAPQLSGTAQAQGLAVGGERFNRISLTAEGSAQNTRFTIKGDGSRLNFDGRGSVQTGETIQVQLQNFSARRSGVRLALASPATISIADGTASFSRLALNAAGGRIVASGKAGDTIDLKVQISRLPLAIARIAQPSLRIGGTLNGEADLRGTIAAPQGTFRATIASLTMPEMRNAGVPPLNIQANGRLNGTRADVNATINGGRTIRLTIAGGVPLQPGGSMSLTARGTVDAGLANASLRGTGRRVTGSLSLNATVRGTFASPQIGGSATLRNGSFRDPLQGIALSNINGSFSGQGNRVVINRLTAATAKGGSLSASGDIRIDPRAGFPGNLNIQARRAQLVSNDIVNLIAGLDLKVSGPLASAPVVSGTINVISLDVSIPDNLPASAEPLRPAKHIHPPKQVRQRLQALAKAKQQQAQRDSASGGPLLNVRVNAPSRIFVRGRGVFAELGGAVTVTGRTSSPQAIGAFELRRGSLNLLTQRIEFSRGRLTFTGSVIPELDFIASTSAGSVTAGIAITGRANDPRFTLTSEPALPPDEVLSRLLFERAAGSLSAFQALQLAQAVATLSGRGGPGFLDKARRAIGVDTLDVGLGKNGPTVGASKYISRRVRVGVKGGATPAESGVTLNLDLSRRIKLQAESNGDGSSAVGIAAEIEY